MKLIIINKITFLHVNINKIIIKKCVEYYLQCWKDRNEDYKNEDKQRMRIITWYQNILEMVEKGGDAQVRKYVQKHQIDVENCRTESIRKWINNVKEFQRKIAKARCHYLLREISQHQRLPKTSITA